MLNVIILVGRKIINIFWRVIYSEVFVYFNFIEFYFIGYQYDQYIILLIELLYSLPSLYKIEKDQQKCYNRPQSHIYQA